MTYYISFNTTKDEYECISYLKKLGYRQIYNSVKSNAIQLNGSTFEKSWGLNGLMWGNSPITILTGMSAKELKKHFR